MDNKPKKIMVVDDEDDLIFLLQILLEQKGFKVNAFTDPLLALQSSKLVFTIWRFWISNCLV